MQIIDGWSGEMANGHWSKLSVSVDENDLMRLLIEHTGNENGSSDAWGANPDLTQAKTSDVFTALSSEAARLKEAALYQRHPKFQNDEQRAEIAALTTMRDAALTRIVRSTHVPVA